MNIPYWLLRLLPMWDYICPKCRKEVGKNSHKCVHCGEQYGIAMRVPPKYLKDDKLLEEYVHKHVFPRVSAKQRTYLTQFFTVFFQDGEAGSTMETAGDFSAWTGSSVGAGSTLEVITAAKYCGLNGAHALRAAWQQAYVEKDLGAGHALLYVRMYVYLISITMTAGSAVDIITTYNSGAGAAKTRLAILNTAGVYNWQLTDKQTGTSALGSVVTTGVWHCIETKGLFAAGTGEARFYLNDVEDITITALNNPLGNPDLVVCGLWCAAGGCGNENELYFDCVVVADTYIGPLVSAPKGTMAIHAKMAGII